MNLYSLTLQEENDSQNAFGKHCCMIVLIQLEKPAGNYDLYTMLEVDIWW